MRITNGLFWSLKQKLGQIFPLHTLFLFGPGIIAAVSGDDAGGIVTYSTIGSRFGYALLWILFLVLTPALVVIQIVSVRLGVVSGKGLAALIRERFSLRISMIGIIALFLANSITSISEFFGIAAALELFSIPKNVGVPIAGILVWWFIVRGTYQRVEKFFLILSSLFLSYVIAAFLARPDWSLVLRHLVVPSFNLSRDYLALLIATIATSITPYMQIYAQSSVVEKGISIKELVTAEFDAAVGSLFSMAIAIFIVITTGATLFSRGITIGSAEDAALALIPLAGEYASILFGFGFFGASILAAGILPLTTAYSTCEAFGWRSGIQYSYRQAPIFYTIFTLLIFLGVIVSIIPAIPLIQLLILAYLINGILLPIELVFILKLANDRDLMQVHTNGLILNFFIVLVTILVSAAVLLLFTSFLSLNFLTLLKKYF